VTWKKYSEIFLYLRRIQLVLEMQSIELWKIFMSSRIGRASKAAKYLNKERKIAVNREKLFSSPADVFDTRHYHKLLRAALSLQVNVCSGIQ
jgi:hypothetical protein